MNQQNAITENAESKSLEVTNTAARVRLAKELVEPLSKVAIMIAALSYAAGFIVVNSYFSRYGFYSMDFFRAGYVSAGLWSLVLLSFSALIFQMLVALPERLKGQKWSKKIDVLVFTIMAPVIVLTLFTYSGIDLGTDFWSSLLTILNGMGATLFWSASGFGNFSKIVQAKEGHIALRFLQNTSFGIAITLVYFLSFGQHIYGHIPVHYGGGKPTNVLIVCDNNSRGALEFSGIKIYDGRKFSYLDSSLCTKSISEPVGMLTESSNSYTVIVKTKDSSYAVTFEKSLASAIIHRSSVVVGGLH